MSEVSRRAYAEGTSVSTERSRAEIESTLRKHGAGAFMFGVAPTNAVVAFEIAGRKIRFILPLPDRSGFARTPGKGLTRTVDARDAAWEQACRERWRALALIIKAKLEAVAAGVVTIEDEFLAQTVMPDNRTVAEHVQSSISIAYSSGEVRPLLEGPLP